MSRIINEKKQIFSDLCIPWDNRIEKEFNAEMSKRKVSDPDVLLDIICRKYIDRAMENYVGTMYDFLKEKCKRGTNYLYEKTIVNTIGKENLQELLKADLVSPIMVGNKQAYLL